MMRLLACLLVGILLAQSSAGNGLRIRQARNSVPSLGRYQLWVSWANGWNDMPTGNHDAVWLFAKQGREVQNHTSPFSVQLIQGGDRFVCQKSQDGLGVWLFPKKGRQFVRDSALLEWTFLPTDDAPYHFRGIEMVYIPAGSFWVGDGVSNKTLSAFGTNPASPFLIRNDDSLGLNRLGGVQVYGTTNQGFVATGFPLGYNAFFLQKYEINEGQWLDFVQSLTQQQRSVLYPSLEREKPTEFKYIRSGVGWEARRLSTSTPHRAMGALQWTDVLAYLDWACLRPMSETEFEKACRGPLPPVAKEFAWGTALADLPQDTLLMDGTDLEGVHSAPTIPLAGWANAARPFNEPYLKGPARQGFAATATSGRVEAGAGYYGCFELSGNVWEYCVLLETESLLDSSTGDGEVDAATGLTNYAGWQALKPIVRGGGHTSLIFNDMTYPFRDLAVSDRYYDTYPGNQRRSTTGGRGARGW